MSENKQVPSRESQMVVLRRDGKGTATVWCDPEIADLVDALNCGSLSTLASCSGHGEKPGIISLKDGRELLILPDYESARMAERAVISASAGEKKDQPAMTVVLRSYPESNGKRNWTAMIRPVEKWDGLIGNDGGITIARGECWNRVAYEAERARFMLGLRDAEPFILDYADDIETPDQWEGESGRVIKKRASSKSNQEQSTNKEDE